MFDWWNTLSSVSQIFVCVAIPPTIVLIFQTIATIIGLSGDSDFGDDIVTDHGAEIIDDATIETSDGVFDTDASDIDADISAFADLRIFTIRGIVAFFVVFGWVGLVLDSARINLWITILVSALCGVIVMILIALLMRAVMRLRNDGNIDNRNAIGVSGKVYLTVPPSRSGEGKINIMLQGVYVERDAVTDETEAITTGSEVVVIGISGMTTLVVKRK